MNALGGSGVRVSALGFGGAVIGNLYRAVPEDVASQAVAAAWDAGIRYFDTAPHYGLGLAERRLGRVLAGRPRHEFSVSTKVGRMLEPVANPSGKRDVAGGFDVPADFARRWDFSADGVRRSLESSADRMGLDRIDLVLLHDPDEHWEQVLDEAYPALHALRAQGVIGAIGVGMNQWPMLRRFVTDTDVDAVMLAGRYTLLDDSGEPLLAECERRGVSVLAAGVFNGGLLATDDPEGNAVYDYRPASTELVARAQRLVEICHRHGVALPQAAIAHAARHPAVASVVLGARTPEEVRRNAELFRAPVPDALWADLASAGS
ncbi:aldo/keto reductase [Saccharopolyspora dendranthemae]|uniref:D-threo-aldose 1-dehydrogenase n=1 Tax=Saccharopolyspora dendranthemae TaxID=1181886 RepID=A0A561U8U9_9PSEU|nr:aldo/keto reductase [Saccharopolyspora dendranthemae]TWF95781.1 D-threo-aldose 1-dehydrogenase [Saccharopolyspora dendranthemae]